MPSFCADKESKYCGAATFEPPPSYGSRSFVVRLDCWLPGEEKVEMCLLVMVFPVLSWYIWKDMAMGWQLEGVLAGVTAARIDGKAVLIGTC